MNKEEAKQFSPSSSLLYSSLLCLTTLWSVNRSITEISGTATATSIASSKHRANDSALNAGELKTGNYTTVLHVNVRQILKLKNHALLSYKSSVSTFLQFSIYAKTCYSLVISFLLNKYTSSIDSWHYIGKIFEKLFPEWILTFFFF